MGKTDFDKLLERYLRDDVTEEERMKMEAWLDEMKVNRTPHAALTPEDENELFKRISVSIKAAEHPVPPDRETTALKPASRHWLTAAAGVCLAVSVSFIAWYLVTNKTTTEVVATNGIEKVILNDGTLVWLHKGGKLIYEQIPGEKVRHVGLQGSAFFEVAKDAQHPFTIDGGSGIAKVLGTSFNIRASEKELELEVLTGKVNLKSLDGGTVVDVVPNEKVLLTKAGTLEKQVLQPAEAEMITAETQYDMQFDNTALEQVFQKIGAKFNVRLTVEDKSMERCRITADFTDRSLDKTFKMLSEMLELNYTIDGAIVTITGRGCNLK